MATQTSRKAARSAVTAQPSAGLAAISPVAKFHAAMETKVPTSAASRRQNQRARVETRRVVRAATVAMAAPSGGGVRSGTGGTSDGEGAALSSSRSMRTGPLRVSVMVWILKRWSGGAWPRRAWRDSPFEAGVRRVAREFRPAKSGPRNRAARCGWCGQPVVSFLSDVAFASLPVPVPDAPAVPPSAVLPLSPVSSSAMSARVQRKRMSGRPSSL